MFSGSPLDQLNLLSLDDFWAINRIPRLMTLPGVITSDDDVPVARPKRIVVSNQLPIKSSFNKDTRKWSFELDNDSLVLQLKDGFDPNVEVVYVGCLKAADIDASDQDDVASYLLSEFNCVPTFLPAETQNLFYHGFCKHYLWPLFHYMLPVSPTQNARFDRAHWRAYVSANKAFADKIMEVINPDEDYVWIQDYHLMVLPTILRKRFHRIKLGFFLHSPFPSSEIYRTIPVRNEILQALLNCDLVGFQTFDYARHFLSCCSRMLGLDYQSKRGYIGLDYYGRTVSIKILPVGIHMGQLQDILSRGEIVHKVRELRERFEGKLVMVGVDDMDLFKGISLKFLALGHLLEQHKSLRGKVVLVQITNPARSQGKDIQDVQEETNSIAEEINRKYGDETSGYKPIVLIKRFVSTLEKAAFYAMSECCVVNAVRDGMNLVPYKYTVCRQGSPVLDRAIGVDEAEPKKSVLIVSEFVGCSPSLSGAIRVNPWNIEAVSDAMSSALKMKDKEKIWRHEKHYKYISSHDVAYWVKSFDQDLERACKDHYSKRYWDVGFGLGFRVVALGPNFRKLSLDRIVSAYTKTKSRLILLDYDGTISPQSSVNKAPSDETIRMLNELCNFPNNVVFIVSGRGKDSLSDWFSPCEKLGISAEHGFFTRWNGDSPWETSSITMDFSWKEIAEPVMEHYTEATDGSLIEQKESALVWHHQDADPHFGSCQAKELLDHLESVLANEPVVVKRAQHKVEVKPQGVSKGLVVESLISKMQSKGAPPDFVLCIGDDHSDEDMFEAISRHASNGASLPSTAEIFACTVGQKPSRAKYYLDEPDKVLELLRGLASASAQQQPKSVPQKSFEAFFEEVS